tara:strand:- start:4128 stop:4334 length:207 start_codon:yes stop_codon:yes gene_type:complete
MESKYYNKKMPSLTIDGKRQIIKDAAARVGVKRLTAYLQTKGIASVAYLNENVRKYKAKLFRELFDLD